jgi:MFS family permease
MRGAGERGKAKGAGGIRAIFANRNFRLLWTGEAISLIGDQFYLVALPWLVLRLTGSALAIGTVLALAAIPRALFMLVGGALTDRLSPRALMLASNACRFMLVGALAVVTFTGAAQLWMIYAFALAFGLADAFFFPAQSAIIPALLGKERLQTGNAIIQGTAQLSLFAGPALAGTLIALLDGGGGVGGVPDLRGIGVAFAIDSLSFLASAATLSLLRLGGVRRLVEKAGQAKTGLLSAIGDGLAAVWRDRTLRYYFILIAAVNLLMTGPISVGIPMLAESKFAGGAAAFGIILSAFGGGSLLGVLLAGMCPRPSARRFPLLMLGCTAWMGVGLALLGFVPSLVPAAALAVLMGCGQGYVVIQFVTWLQIRTPAAMLGRMMSVLMFAVMGLAPVSSAVSGVFIQRSASAVLICAGLMMAVIVGVAALSPSVWRLGDEKQHSDDVTLEPHSAAA